MDWIKRFFESYKKENPKLGKRTALVIGAVILMGFCLSWLILADLGTDPCTSMNLGLSGLLGISLGNWQVLFNSVLFIIVILYAPKKIGIGTLANMVLVGYSIDFFQFIWAQILPEGCFASMAVRIAVMIPALAVFIFAAALYMAVDLGASPYDVIPYIIAARLHKVSFRTVRICFDITAVVIGYVTGSTIGVVTVIMACLLGPAIAAVEKQVQKRLGMKPVSA